jgi:tetratricopeptide (TPR) repeat protein
MKNVLFLAAFYNFAFLMYQVLPAQSGKFLQIELNAGISEPVQEFRSQHMFSGRGVSASGGFDYFFNHFGIGFSGGYFTNESGQSFTSYIEHKYFEKLNSAAFKDWNTKYIVFGPSIKFSLKKFEFDLFAKGGYSQILVPDLLFSKRFFSQTFEVYRFSGTSDDWQFAWSGGARAIFKVTDWLGLQAKADYFTTSYLSTVGYDNTFRDANDGNRNGIIEDAEYFESQKVINKGTSNLSVLNMNLGLVFHLGKKSATKPAQMLPELPEVTMLGEEMIVQSEPVAVEIKKEENKEIVHQPTQNQEKPKDEIPVVNADEEIAAAKTAEEQVIEKIEIPVTTYDAPEAKYDAEAAEFLYKAGESYFATNDFENAMPCFNKLKADPKYPRAKYMFALALCAMGNCTEAKKEYKEFAKTYKETDSRTLEIIFASHFERCSISGKLKVEKSTPAQESTDKDVMPVEYKIQFIAMRKPDVAFPRLANVGTVSTEFFPNKAVYRYTLGGYSDINSAATDVYKVRKMGFRDAFVAMYKNGVRVNTLYHAR